MIGEIEMLDLSFVQMLTGDVIVLAVVLLLIQRVVLLSPLGFERRVLALMMLALVGNRTRLRGIVVHMFRVPRVLDLMVLLLRRVFLWRLLLFGTNSQRNREAANNCEDQFHNFVSTFATLSLP